MMTAVLTFGLDVEVERKGLLAKCQELLEAGRGISPTVVFYKLSDRIMAISVRPSEDELDFHKSLQEVLFLFPALSCTSAMLALQGNVLLTNNQMQSAIITVALTKTGADSEAHPYYIEDGTVVWMEDAKLHADSKMYSEYIDHMLPIFATTGRFPFRPSEVLEFLSDRRHDIEFFGNWGPSNIDI